MMIIKQNKNKTIILISAIILVAIAAVIYFAFFFKTERGVNDVDYGKPSDEQIKSGAAIKERGASKADSSKSNMSGSDRASAPILQADGRGKVDATMTAANRNGSVMQIRFSIGAVVASGTCTLTLTKDEATLKKTSGVQALAGNSTCAGFDIPISELESGSWNSVLHFENDQLIADTTGTITVQ